MTTKSSNPGMADMSSNRDDEYRKAWVDGFAFACQLMEVHDDPWTVAKLEADFNNQLAFLKAVEGADAVRSIERRWSLRRGLSKRGRRTAVCGQSKEAWADSGDLVEGEDR